MSQVTRLPGSKDSVHPQGFGVDGLAGSWGVCLVARGSILLFPNNGSRPGLG